MNEWNDDEILKLEVGFLLNAMMLFKHSKDKEYAIRHTSRLFYRIEKMDETEGNVNFIQSIFSLH